MLWWRCSRAICHQSRAHYLIPGLGTDRSDDAGQEQAEGVERGIAAHVYDGVEPGLPILDGGPEIRHAELLVLGGRLLIGFQAADDPLSIGLGEEGGLVREIEDHPEAGDPHQDRRQPFQDENPGPSPLAANAIHLSNRSGEQATERARHRCSREEDGGTDAELGSFIPAAQIVVDAGEQPRLGESQPPPRRHHALEVMGQAHGHHDRAPQHHDDGDEDRRAQALEQDVRQGLEERVGDEEDGQAGIVLAARDVEGVGQAVEFGIADVGAVEEGDEVEEAEPGDQADVEFPEESAVLSSYSVRRLQGSRGRSSAHNGLSLCFTETGVGIGQELDIVSSSSLKLVRLQIGVFLVIGGRAVAVAILHLGLMVYRSSSAEAGSAGKQTLRKPLRICTMKDGERAMWDDSAY